MTPQDTRKILKPEQMKKCADDLNVLASDTEREFLQIGETLNKLAAVCYSMTDDAVRLSTLSNFNEEGAAAGESFVTQNVEIFDNVVKHVKSAISSLGEGDSLLADLLAEVKKLRDPLQRLNGIGKTFRVLGVSIKVESSRNQNATHGFRLLADEVAEISQLVQKNCRFCIEKTDVVERAIDASRKVLHTSESSYDDAGERGIHTVLHSLEEISRKSEMLASGIQERSAAMVHGIGDVVMAMQFHDITRQQLENVSYALRDIAEKAGQLLSETNEEVEEHAILEIYTILSVQAAHLNSIYEQIFNARNQIGRGLRETMEQAGVQAQDARTLLEIESGGENKSVVLSLEREVEKILASLNASMSVVKQAAEVSKDVYDDVSEIGNFVNTIEDVAFDVKVLAINAMVEAIKTDAVGNTLIVLAKELSNLSQETRDQAANSIELLQEIIKGTEKQLEYTTNLDQNSTLVDEMAKQAGVFTGTVLQSLQNIAALAQKMDSSSRDLSSRITKLIPGIRFPQVMGDRIDKNWRIICETIDRIDQHYPQFLEKNTEVKEMLEQLSQQYVMDRERSIHAQVTGGGVLDEHSGDVDLFEDDGIELFDDEGEVSSKEKKKEEQDFGDNVELF
ncbi:MAG: methyl-accepting chemotaxis protein [Desulfopila sp.]|jgi:methyl-accepting chemotaxis protein|nr:methyl-accepting chemotaxis protein [Desulfopila sp.]